MTKHISKVKTYELFKKWMLTGCWFGNMFVSDARCMLCYRDYAKSPAANNNTNTNTNNTFTRRVSHRKNGFSRFSGESILLIFSFFLHIWYGAYGCLPDLSENGFFGILAIFKNFTQKNIYAYPQYDNFVSIFIENNCWKMWDFVASEAIFIKIIYIW
jgi:hypothetical protein